MKESDFGKQYFAIFGSAKDNISNNLTAFAMSEGIDVTVASRMVSVAQQSVDQAASNAYDSLWNSVKKFFRQGM